jgi:hypothetical protein
LFVKARVGLGGEGAERLCWDGTTFKSNRGHHISPEEVSGYLAERARNEKRILLVQPALSNHPDLRAESNEALVSARLVTGRSTAGHVLAIFGVIHFPQCDRITAHRNYVALIDVENGRLIPAPSQDSPGTLIYRYRQTDCDTLPDWNAALQHVKAAHQVCSNFAFIGWDLAFTEHGPMLLEGNANWCADTYQSLRGTPLGDTKFAAILTTRLGL